MASLTDPELVRARWRRHLRAETLDTIQRDDFARRVRVRLTSQQHRVGVA